MGAYWSSSTNKSREDETALPIEGNKRQKLLAFDSEEMPRMFSSLPDELSMQILAKVPRGCYSNLRMVCKTWNNVLQDEIFKLREELGVKEEWLYILLKDEEEKLHWYSFDPISCKWYSLPRMPDIVQEEDSNQTVSGWSLWNAMGNSSIRLLSSIVKGWFGRKDPLDRTPFCGCAVGSLNGCLYVLGGFSRACAMRCVWRYDPRINVWTEVASMTTARAYCKTASLNNKLYAVGGVNRGRGGLIPLQSAEVYDPVTNTWTQISGMPFGRARIPPTAFLADMLKPIATGMTAFRGKLCVPQSLYSWPFFVDVGGEMYDPDADGWIEMPFGMGDGWPARQAGTKLSVVVNGNLYALDPSSSLDSGKIKMYDPQEDAWKVVFKKVPVLDFTDSESPYLLAGFKGKLHVITKDNRDDVAILQADTSKPGNASSSSSTSADSSESEGDGWRSIASRAFGFVELVNCQVVDI